MNYILIVAELVVIVAAVVLIRFMGSGTEHRGRIAALGTAFAVATFAATGVSMLATVNYRWPVTWIVAVIVAVGAMVALGFLLGRALEWEMKRLVAAAILLGVSSFAFGVMMTAEAFPEFMQQRFLLRAKQIATHQEIPLLMLTDRDLVSDTLPVDTYPSADVKGIVLMYEGLEIAESRTDLMWLESDLVDLVASGENPFQKIDVPKGSKVTTLTVAGLPAAAIEILQTPAEKNAEPVTVTFFAMVRDGMLIRMRSSARDQLIDGKWTLAPGYTPAELGELAAGLELVE